MPGSPAGLAGQEPRRPSLLLLPPCLPLPLQDNERLVALQGWLDRNHDGLKSMHTWLHDHLRLPNITHLGLPSIGGWVGGCLRWSIG